MRASSAKNKGRRASQEVKDILLKHASNLVSDDIVVTSSGTCGEDLKLSPLARKSFPVALECKNVEKIKVWEAIKQAEAHAEGTEYHPVVAFKRNNTKLRCIIDFDLFVRLLVHYGNR